MKQTIYLTLFLLLFSTTVFSQKIEKDYYDQFTGKRIMYTNLEKINWKHKNKGIGGKMQMRFILNDNFQYMVLHWYSDAYLEIFQDAGIQFKLDDGSAINLKNELHASSIKGGTGLSKNNIGVMLNCLGDIPRFSAAHVIAVRIYTSEGYYDFEIDKKDGEKIHKSYMLFRKIIHVGG